MNREKSEQIKKVHEDQQKAKMKREALLKNKLENK